MFLLSTICGCVPNLFLTRGIFCSSTCRTNHYMTLGLTPAATQGDIKKAYFELCKKYHPDKNEGSPESTQMFRKITEAYEILGNEKSRRLYDQKMFYAGPRVRQTVQHSEDYNYEAERYFYERTHPRRRYTGKTKNFNFDAWEKAHYPRSRGEEFRDGKYYSRTWTKGSQSSSSYCGITRKPITTIYIIGFFLIGIIMASLPMIYISPNYGLKTFEIDYGEHLSKKVELDEEEFSESDS